MQCTAFALERALLLLKHYFLVEARARSVLLLSAESCCLQSGESDAHGHSSPPSFPLHVQLFWPPLQVDKRYKTYKDSIQPLVFALSSVTGHASAAVPYTAPSLQAVSIAFRATKDNIKAHLRQMAGQHYV